MAAADVVMRLQTPLCGPRCASQPDGKQSTQWIGDGLRWRNVTFLVNYPWNYRSTEAFPLSELPVLTSGEIQQFCLAGSSGGALARLTPSVDLPESLSGLYVPGSFLLRFAATRAGMPLDVAAKKLRVVLQDKEIQATSFLPLESVVGAATAAAVGSARSGEEWHVAPDAAGEETISAPLCSLWLLLRLPGGKGGFGALLKKQRRKKRANFSIDACRDLTGRRIRQAQVVTRIKAWMEKKRKEDALVAALTQGAPQEKQPEAAPSVSLDPTFISQQIAHVSEMPDLVARGLKQQMALREKQEAEQRRRNAAPQNRAVYAQLRDAVELVSDEDQWSDLEMHEELSNCDEDSSSSSANDKNQGSVETASESCSSSVTTRPQSRSNSSSSSSSSSRSSSSSSSSSKGSNGKPSSQPAKADAAAVALLEQLEQMRLKAASAQAAERSRKAAAEAQALKAAATAKKAAAEAAERLVREAQALDVSRFNTAEELAQAVDESVVKEKLKQLGWKCGGRPEERAARLMHLKTVDLANVPKALLARQPTRKA
ncbi:hypothetical protein Efla_003612 [Eimeria flavescens]